MKSIINIFIVLLIASCANMVAPLGGDKDITPPLLLHAETVQVTKLPNKRTIKLDFDEYIQLNKWDEYFYISPPLDKKPKKRIKGKALFLDVEGDLHQNTTYHVSFNSCIKDNNEGNILDTLTYRFSTTDIFDTLTISGTLKEAYSLNPMTNCWVMLFDKQVKDSSIFKQTPNYIAKTDKNGFFYFPNLREKEYKITALTGVDYNYNKEEKIAFLDSLVNPKIDSFISLFAFNPIIKRDSLMIDSISVEKDRNKSGFNVDTISLQKSLPLGTLKININQDAPCVFQLLQDEKLIKEVSFIETPHVIKDIFPGEYQLKYIIDNNQDSMWNTGSWENRIQPERVLNYPFKIIIRSNWDLELEWFIEE